MSGTTCNKDLSGLEEEIAELEKIIANRPNMAIAERRLAPAKSKRDQITTIRRIIVDPKQPTLDDDKEEN